MSKFNKIFVDAIVTYNAPATQDLQQIVQEANWGPAIARQYTKFRNSAQQLANTTKRDPMEGWLRVLFGYDEREDIMGQIERAMKSKDKKFKGANGKEYDLRNKEVMNLLKSLLKKQKNEKPEPEPKTPVTTKPVSQPRTAPRPARQPGRQPYQPPRTLSSQNLNPPRT